MSLIPDSCIESNDNRSECVATENGKTFKIINRSKVEIKKVKIDHCIKQEIGERRCDYLMAIEEADLKRVFFIELKGGGLGDAIKQIHSTINYLQKEIKGFQLEARIIGSRDVPDLKNTPQFIKLQKQIYPTKGTIKIATNKFFSENI